MSHGENMRICSVVFSALALGAAALGAGCTEPAASREAARSAIAIPLTQQLGSKIYHLTANFEITGPDGTVQRVDGTGNDPSVTVQVTPGINAIQLLDGWTLSRSTDGGATFEPVSAVLGTMNPVNLVVDPSRVSTWEFDFIVRDATTQLNITFGVVEQPRQISMQLFIEGGFGEFAK